MIHLLNIEEINDSLLHLPRLIDEFEQRDAAIVEKTKKWLVKLETILMNNRMALAGTIAALRGTLLASERGLIPEGITITGKSTPRKIREVTATQVIRKASEAISIAMIDDTARISEANRLGLQVVTLARSKGILSSLGVADGLNITEVWGILLRDSDVAPGMVRLLALVGQNDAMIIIDRSISVT
jgi:hypothetical protein